MNKIFIGLALVACLTTAALYGLRDKTYTLTFTQGEIQQRLESAFPMEKTFLGFLNIKIQNPRVILQDGSKRIGFQADEISNLNWNGKPLCATALMSGELRYDATLGQIFLDDFRIDAIKAEGLKEEYASQLKSTATQLAQEYLKRRPVYTLTDTDLKIQAARLLLKNVTVEKGMVRVVLGL